MLESKKGSNRIEWVDMGKGICMLFVILSHTIVCPDILRTFFAPFFLSGFFFLSGYVYKPGKSFKVMLRKKICTILVPWAAFSIFEVIELYLFGNSNLSLAQYFGCAILQVKGYYETLWFLPCLFLSFLPFYFGVRFLSNRNMIVLSFILCMMSRIYSKYMIADVFPWRTSALPWHIQLIGVVWFFMVVGYLYAQYEEKIVAYLRIKKAITIGAVFALYIGLLYIINTQTKIELNEYDSNIFIWMIVMFIALFLFIIITYNIRSFKGVIFIGKNSLLYYCLHFTLIRIFNKAYMILGVNKVIGTQIWKRCIFSFGEVVIIVILLIIPIWFINKYLGFLLGKFNRDIKV